MRHQPILVEIAEPVAYVTLNRPEQRNPLDWSSVRQLKGAIERLDGDDSVRIVVILVGRAELLRRRGSEGLCRSVPQAARIPPVPGGFPLAARSHGSLQQHPYRGG